MYLFDPESGPERRAQARDCAERALETTTDALGSAYETTTHALGETFDSVSHKAADAGAAAYASLPSSRDAKKTGRRWLSSAGDYLGSAKSYLPTMRRQPDYSVSPTTAGIGAAGALALGLGAMWLFDPERGRGRPAWIGQKTNRALNETSRFMSATGRHLRNKAQGYYHEGRSLVGINNATTGNTSDDAIAENVRFELGRTSTPGSIGVRCENGRVTLTGRCASSDVDRVLGCAHGVAGVTYVENQLDFTESGTPSTTNFSA